MLILLVRRDKPAGCLRMGVPHGEELATHAGLESCVAVRKFSHFLLLLNPAGQNYFFLNRPGIVSETQNSRRLAELSSGF